MDQDSSRILRLRMSDARDSPGLGLEHRIGAASTSRGTPRFVGRVQSGGAIPTATDRVFLVNPVKLYGTEAEGAAGVLVADDSRTIPVVVIGQTAPGVGDLLLAFSVGGRWVAEFGGGGATLPCSPCVIPKKNLTLSWTNNLLGSGSGTLVFSPPDQWNSSCINQMLFQLSCSGSMIQLSVTYFVGGGCPSGQSQSCTSLDSAPHSLTLASFSCNPFLLHFTVTSGGCPALWSNGYTALTITE
jgi:hypothetical protein